MHHRKPSLLWKSPYEIFLKKETAAIRSLVHPNMELILQRKNDIFYLTNKKMTFIDIKLLVLSKQRISI